MTEVHRYNVVKMLSEGGNRISYDPHGPEVVMAEAYDQLKAEKEALRKDAERYRWLRESGQCEWDVRYEKLELRIETPHFDDSNLDACIDSAMAKEASHV